MISFLLAFLGAAPVTLSLSSSEDSSWVRLPIRVVEVRDNRRLAGIDRNGLGVTETGLFEERVPLRTPKPVAEEVRSMVSQWGIPDSGAFPVRLELVSFETWPVMASGPDPVKTRVKVRVVSADPEHPGLILTPSVEGENKGFHSAKEQVSMLREHLRDALQLVKPGMKPVLEGANPEPTPALDTSADPRRLTKTESVLPQIRHTFWLGGLATTRTFSMSLRYSQFAASNATWTQEYWGGLQVRAPWNQEKFDNVWAGDLMGGMAWWRRLDDGRSPISLIGSLGGMLGTETYQRVHPDGLGPDKRWIYAGAEARGGIRADRSGSLIAEGGAFLSARIPSVIAWFDPGFYFQMGYRL